MRPKHIKTDSVVLETELYPRGSVDSVQVTKLCESLESGSVLPPIVIDQKGRVIDGFHRVRAHQRLKIDEIMAEVKKVADDKEFLLESIRYNSQHGKPMDRHDQVRCAHLAERLEVDPDLIAGVLHMPVDKFEALTLARTARGSYDEPVSIKGTIGHMRGQKLTEFQRTVNKKCGGMSQSYYPNRLIDLIQGDLVNMENDKMIERLRVLRDLLNNMTLPEPAEE